MPESRWHVRGTAERHPPRLEIRTRRRVDDPSVHAGPDRGRRSLCGVRCDSPCPSAQKASASARLQPGRRPRVRLGTAGAALPTAFAQHASAIALDRLRSPAERLWRVRVGSRDALERGHGAASTPGPHGAPRVDARGRTRAAPAAGRRCVHDGRDAGVVRRGAEGSGRRARQRGDGGASLAATCSMISAAMTSRFRSPSTRSHDGSLAWRR